MNIGFSEDLTREFKGCHNRFGLDKGSIVDVLVAMSNTKGGSLYIGVENDGTITGVTDEFADVNKIVAYVGINTNPSLSVSGEVVSEYDFPIVRIDVRQGRGIVATSSGKILRRRMKMDGTPENVPIYPYEINSRLSDLTLLDFSAQMLAGTAVSDFNPIQRERLRQIIEASPEADKSLLNLDDEELDRALRFVALDNGKWVPTVAGMLMLGSESALQQFLPTAQATFQVLEGTNVRVNFDCRKPVLETLEIFEKYFSAWNPEQEMEEGLFRISVPEFSYKSYREAIINAFCHRDYARDGRVRVMINDDELVISNPGGFVEGITFENLLTAEPHGRNPLLADVLKRLGLVERTGRGVDRIFEGAICYGRPWPDYSQSTDIMVRVEILRSEADMGFMKMLSDYSKDAGQPLSVLSLMLLSLLRSRRRVEIKNLAECCYVTVTKASSVLAKLLEAGLIEKIAHGRTWEYMLSSTMYKSNDALVKYVRQRGIDEVKYEAMIIELAKKQGNIINNADVRELLNIDKNKAYALLKSMQKNGRIKLLNGGKYSKYCVADE